MVYRGLPHSESCTHKKQSLSLNNQYFVYGIHYRKVFTQNTELEIFLLDKFIFTRKGSPYYEPEVIGTRCEKGASPVPLDTVNASLVRGNGN